MQGTDMHDGYNEADWKILRHLQPIALDRLCGRILKEAAELASSDRKSSHDRYLELYALIKRRDEDVAHAFNDMRRSRMLERVMAIKRLGLLTDDEFSRFSGETRQVVNDVLAHHAMT